jgi:hypothetical protein
VILSPEAVAETDGTERISLVSVLAVVLTIRVPIPSLNRDSSLYRPIPSKVPHIRHSAIVRRGLGFRSSVQSIFQISTINHKLTASLLFYSLSIAFILSLETTSSALSKVLGCGINVLCGYSGSSRATNDCCQKRYSYENTYTNSHLDM